jgi:hypothetical protein
MSKSTHQSLQGEDPPLVVGTPIYDEDLVRVVVLDEELSLSRHCEDFLEMEQSCNPSATMSPLEVEPTVRHRRRAIRLYATTGTLLMLLELTFLVTVVVHFSTVRSRSSNAVTVSMRALC